MLYEDVDVTIPWHPYRKGYFQEHEEQARLRVDLFCRTMSTAPKLRCSVKALNVESATFARLSQFAEGTQDLFSNLERLVLRRFPMIDGKIYPKGKIDAANALTELRHCQEGLKRLPSLSDLSLRESSLRFDHLKSFLDVPNLQRLRLSNVKCLDMHAQYNTSGELDRVVGTEHAVTDHTAWPALVSLTAWVHYLGH